MAAHLSSSISRLNGAASAANVPNGCVWLMVALLLFVPVSAKAAGLAFFCLLGLAVWATLRRPVVFQDFLAVQWLAMALAVLVLRALATLYWGESWGGRHFEVRIALAGLIVWCLARRIAWSDGQKDGLAHGLALGCWSALAVTWLHGRDTPTNPIPWAAGVGFMVCVLLMRAFAREPLRAQRMFWLISAWAGMGAVLLSQSRGSFGLLPWLALASVWIVWRTPRRSGHRVLALTCAGVLVAVLLGVISLQPRLYKEPLARLAEAEREVVQLAAAVAQDQVRPEVLDTSVGARAYMYIRGWQEIQRAPGLGHGADERKAWVLALGASSGSQVIQSLQHLHSDPLNIAFDHGLLGWASYMVLVVGLVWLGWRARVRDGSMTLGLVGLAWMHASSGLTNLNTMHNFYGAVLSVSVVLVFALGRSPCMAAGSD